MTSSDQSAENEWGVPGAGALLRQAREARGLLTQEVAGKLRLDVRYIEAMEHDEYTQLIAPVFVRGYLRSYARFLNLSPEAIVTSYEYQKGSASKALHGRSIFSDDDTKKDRSRLHWIIYSAVLASLVVGVWWWQMKGTAKFWEDQTVEAPETESSAASALTNSAPTKTAAAPSVKTANSSAPVQNTGQTKSPALSPPPTLPMAAANPAAGPIAPTAATPAQGPSTQAPSAIPNLTLKVTVDSWVDITDAEGKRLIYKVLAAGTTQTLQDLRLPLKIVLGKAAGVSLEYNGKPFDHSRYQHNGVARFDLGSVSPDTPNNKSMQ